MKYVVCAYHHVVSSKGNPVQWIGRGGSDELTQRLIVTSHFVSLLFYLFVRLMFSFSLRSAYPLHLFSVWVFWPLTPHFTHCWLVIKDERRCPTLAVCPHPHPSTPGVGGSKLSIKCFCWDAEKIRYGEETKVICTRKFNCLSLWWVWASVWLPWQINFTWKQFRRG